MSDEIGTLKSNAEGARWYDIQGLIRTHAQEHNLEVEEMIRTTGLFSQSVFYKLKGRLEDLHAFVEEQKEFETSFNSE